MKQRLVALVALALLLAAVVVGNATAATPMTPAEAQATGQQALSGQGADTTAGSGQYQPANQAAPTSIGSPGAGGDVTQTNLSAAAAISANENETDQTAEQTQAGGAGGSFGQAAGQAAESDQTADSDADSTQVQPSNVNVPIRIGSKGDGGDVTQTNASLAAATSANGNETDQSVDQSQSGGGSSCCSGGSSTQAAGQAAKSEQDADSDADSTQKAPSNVNVPIRILSPGDDGDVTQTNASLAAAASANGNETDQSVDQSQSGGGSSCCSGGSSTQAAGQEAKSEQDAESDADSTQVKPRNVNVPIRILSPGDDGDVTQTNLSAAAAASLNANATDQSVDQTQSGRGSRDGSKCCSGASYVQAAGQESKSEQKADSDADSTQYGASNVNVPIRIGSKGDGGDVTQTNASLAAALSANGNKTDQSIDQTQSGGGPAYGSGSDSKYDPKYGGPKYGGKCGCSSDALYTQAAGQESKNDQWADSDADSKQVKPSNVNVPVRIGSKGDDGDVAQTNLSAAAAASLNGNKTDQSIDQTQAVGRHGGHTCCGSDAILIQAAGQESKSEQGARSDADSTQYGASNVNAPVRIGSKGDGGDVTQTNASLAAALSANGNKTDQDLDQTQSGGSHDPRHDPRCGCASDALYVQAAGQSAKNDQWADSEADSKQVKPSNVNVPVRIGSKGDDGDVAQTNASLAAALSANANKAHQSVDQTQTGGGSGTIAIQAAGQEAKSEQGARSDADSTQYGASNVTAPVRIGSKGDDGDVTQTNLSAALAASLNANTTHQSLDQIQGGGGSMYARKHDPRKHDPRKHDPKCGCSDALLVQAAGQESHNDQWADSDAESKQHGASNVWDPVRIDSKGGHGGVAQLNASLVAVTAANGNATGTHASQHQAGSGSSYQQALGQAAGNRQKAGSRGRSDQGKAKSKRKAPSYKRGGRHLVD